jgi:hypothetical protein
MQAKGTGLIALAAAIVLGAAMICATLVVLNVRVIYPRFDLATNTTVMDDKTYVQMLAKGCSQQLLPGGGNVSISCPLWVRS